MKKELIPMTQIQLWQYHLLQIALMLQMKLKDFSVHVSAEYLPSEDNLPDTIVLGSDVEDDDSARVYICIDNDPEAKEKYISFMFERHQCDEKFSEFAKSKFSASILGDDEAIHKIASFFSLGEVHTKFFTKHDSLRVPAMLIS